MVLRQNNDTFLIKFDNDRDKEITLEIIKSFIMFKTQYYNMRNKYEPSTYDVSGYDRDLIKCSNFLFTQINNIESLQCMLNENELRLLCTSFELTKYIYEGVFHISFYNYINKNHGEYILDDKILQIDYFLNRIHGYKGFNYERIAINKPTIKHVLISIDTEENDYDDVISTIDNLYFEYTDSEYNYKNTFNIEPKSLHQKKIKTS